MDGGRPRIRPAALTPYQGDRARVLVMGRALAARFGDQHRAHRGGRRALPRGRRRVQRGAGPHHRVALVHVGHAGRPRPRRGAAAFGARAGRRSTRRDLPLAVRERARAHPPPPRRCRPAPSSATSAHGRSPGARATSSLERIALNQIGWSRLAAGEPQPELFTRALELSLRLRNEDGDAYALEGLAGSAAVVGDVERAGFLLGAAEALRARTGLHEQRSYVTYQSIVDAVLATDRAAEFEAARVVGRRMPRRAVLEIALDPETVAAATGARVRRRCRRERGQPVVNGAAGPRRSARPTSGCGCS